MPDGLPEVIRKTRPMLLPYWGNVEGSKKARDEYSLVTELDLAIEQYLREELEKIEPETAFVGEESGGSRDAERFWLCDPIDGTLLFSRGLPFCTVQLARIERGTVTFSVIYDFLNDVLFHAVRGHGAHRNGERIRISEREPERSIIILETKLHHEPQNILRAEKIEDRIQVMRSLVAGYEFTMVATGKVEGRVCVDPWGKDYDYAPGSLLVEEAGGIVATIGSSSYDFRDPNMIAASPAAFRRLTEGPDAIFPVDR